MSALLVVMLTVSALNLDDWLGPPPMAVECSPHMLTYPPESTPVEGAVTVSYGAGETWELKPGFLVSECDWVHILNMKSAHRRQGDELAILWDLVRRETLLWQYKEGQYEAAILDLQDNSWWRDHAFVLGLVTGVVVVGGAWVVQ